MTLIKLMCIYNEYENHKDKLSILWKLFILGRRQTFVVGYAGPYHINKYQLSHYYVSICFFVNIKIMRKDIMLSQDSRDHLIL